MPFWLLLYRMRGSGAAESLDRRLPTKVFLSEGLPIRFENVCVQPRTSEGPQRVFGIPYRLYGVWKRASLGSGTSVTSVFANRLPLEAWFKAIPRPSSTWPYVYQGISSSFHAH